MEYKNLPDSEKIAAIDQFFYEKEEQLGDFKRISDDEFANLLNKLLGEKYYDENQNWHS